MSDVCYQSQVGQLFVAGVPSDDLRVLLAYLCTRPAIASHFSLRVYAGGSLRVTRLTDGPRPSVLLTVSGGRMTASETVEGDECSATHLSPTIWTCLRHLGVSAEWLACAWVDHLRHEVRTTVGL